MATGGGSLSLQSVGGSISGLTITDSTFSMDAASTATLGGTIHFEGAATGELTGTSIVAGSLCPQGASANACCGTVGGMFHADFNPFAGQVWSEQTSTLDAILAGHGVSSR